MSDIKIEPSEVTLAIIRRLYPGRDDITVGEAMDEIANVRGLESLLEKLATDATAPDGRINWRYVAIDLLRTMKGMA